MDFKRHGFLKRIGSFSESAPKGVNRMVSPQKGRLVKTKEVSGSFIHEAQGMGRHKYTPGYEPTNIFFTRDSLYWGWQRVKEYYRDLLEFRGDERKEKTIRIDRG